MSRPNRKASWSRRNFGRLRRLQPGVAPSISEPHACSPSRPPSDRRARARSRRRGPSLLERRPGDRRPERRRGRHGQRRPRARRHGRGGVPAPRRRRHACLRLAPVRRRLAEPGARRSGARRGDRGQGRGRRRQPDRGRVGGGRQRVRGQHAGQRDAGAVHRPGPDRRAGRALGRRRPRRQRLGVRGLGAERRRARGAAAGRDLDAAGRAGGHQPGQPGRHRRAAPARGRLRRGLRGGHVGRGLGPPARVRAPAHRAQPVRLSAAGLAGHRRRQRRLAGHRHRGGRLVRVGRLPPGQRRPARARSRAGSSARNSSR